MKKIYIITIIIINILFINSCIISSSNKDNNQTEEAHNTEEIIQDTVYYILDDTIASNNYEQENIQNVGSVDPEWKKKWKLSQAKKKAEYDAEYIKWQNEQIALEHSITKEESEKLIDTLIIEYNKTSNIGTIVYKQEDTMYVGEPTRVQLIISKQINKSHIIKVFKDTSNIFSEKIRVSKRMEIRLHGNSKYFKIEKIIKKSQIIEDSSYTIWMWDVTPLIKGDYELLLTVYICDGDSEKLIESYTNIIKIQSNETFWSKILFFLKDNWKWFLSTLIIPIFLFYKKKKKNK